MEITIKLGSNENTLGPSPKAIEAVRQAALNMNRYPGVEARDLCCKLADALGPGFDADNVIVGNGSADVILSAAQAFLFEGGEVIISHPAFQVYEMATNMYGGQCVFVNARDYRYDLQAMADKITARTRIIFITNPNNPTGLIVSQQAVDSFMKEVPPSVVIVFDEAYHEYVDAEEYPDATRYVREGRNVLITRTFSKVYALAGMRVGYGVARQELVESLLRTQPPFHTSRLSLVAAMASLADQDHVERSRQVNAEGKEYLYRSFEELGLRYLPSQANYVMLFDLEHDVEAINQALLQRGVMVRPTAPFRIPQAIRVTVGTREENERMVEALRQTLEELVRENHKSIGKREFR